MPDLVVSIITGTYNRINSLKAFCASVRDSIGIGIPYEIVLVDGGSKDGTLEWARAQSDITLIEQGELLGAIKAFNAGAYAARGIYVILANDDIVFLDESIPRAISYMQDHPTLGVGCFFQDRLPIGPWHVEIMPVVYRGKQASFPYGQVCIVPKWLGDEVGWWGTSGARTYGGDNELSCQVYERGYKVLPCCDWRREMGGVPWAAIHDQKAEDGLRAINAARSAADSTLWGRRWTRQVNGQRMTGPIVKETPYKENPIPRFRRVLYLPIFEPGHEVQKHQKRGLREALARDGLVYEFDYMSIANKHGSEYMRNWLMDIADCFRPDVILTQIHTPDGRYFAAEHIAALRKEYPETRFVNWNGDYHPDDLFSEANMALARQFDLQCVVTTAVAEPYRRKGINWSYWQIGYEPLPENLDGAVFHDVIFQGNGYSPQRHRFARLLKSQSWDVGIYGSWPSGLADGYSLYDFDKGARLYRAAKIALGDDQWKAPGFVSNRLFQAMAAGGAMYMQEKVPALDKLLGLQDGVHYVSWTTDTLIEKIAYYLEHENERSQIAQAGAAFVREYHSFDQRVAQLWQMLYG